MWLRVWRGWTRAEDAEAYSAYMSRVALPGYADVDGCTAVYLTRRIDGVREEFCMVTVWDSLDAIRRFAGASYDQAVFYDEDDRYLVEREWTVAHYEIFAAGPAAKEGTG